MAEADRESQADQKVHPESQARREFLMRIGKAGATVPAVSLLLAASFKHASAQNFYGDASGGTGSGSS